MTPRLGTAAALVALAACAGCERVTDDMTRQPRYNPASTSPMFGDGQATRPPVAGTIVHAAGDLAQTSSGRAGLIGQTRNATQQIAGHDAEQGAVDRGRARYAIYCAPCHGARGAGNGEVVRRGFPAPPPLASAALRDASDARLLAAIHDGVGVMGPFADRIAPADAQAIVAYVRVLQREPDGGGTQ